MKALVIGAGNIGTELCDRIIKLEGKVSAVVRSGGIYKSIMEGGDRIGTLDNFDDYMEDIDVGFIAIPTLDDGRIAVGYMLSLLHKGIPVVTAEKGALGNYFPELKKYRDMIGCSAACGGESGILDFAKRKYSEGFHTLTGVVNGTLNYIFDRLSKGEFLSDAINEAIREGYVEQGFTDGLDLINSELRDVALKSSILVNYLGIADVRAKDFKLNPVGKEDMFELMDNARRMRCLVSLSRDENKDRRIGGFEYYVGEWHLSAGFYDVTRMPHMKGKIPEDVMNMMCVERENAHPLYSPPGMGAGAVPTVSAMLEDSFKVVRKVIKRE